MRLKSYFASTVEAAMSLARQELGPDAMLVDSRRTGVEARHLGDYEVVCAVLPPQTPDPEPAEIPGASSAITASSARPPSLDRITREVSELKQQMERLATTLARSTAGFGNFRSDPEMVKLFSTLTGSGLDATLAQDIISKCLDRAPEGANIHALVAEEIDRRLLVDTRLGVEGAKQHCIALVGPPGSGKTTTLVKLAARYGLAGRRSAQILSLDTYRIGAADQLRSYAAILGLGFQILENPIALAQALEECRQKDLILIDTPGWTNSEMEEAAPMANFLSRNPSIDTHLVLPVSMKDGDLLRVAKQFDIYHPDKLIFTRLDETETFGSILNHVIRTAKPVSFLAAGQQIPEDLEPASKPALLKLLLPGNWADPMGAVAAA